MSKRIRVAAVALAGLLLIAALAWTTPQAEKKEAGGVVRLGVQSSQWADALSGFFDEFTAETGIRVEMESISFGVMYERLKSGFVGGTVPYDMIWYDSMWTPEFSQQGWVQDLRTVLNDPQATPAGWGYPEDFFGADYSGNYEAGNQWNLPEGVYGIPLIAGFRPLYYRTDLLEKAGYAEPPKTLDDLLAYAQKLNGIEEGTSGYVMEAGRPRIAYDWSGYLWTMGGDFFDENLRPVFNSPEGVRALELYIELGKVAPAGTPNYHITETWEAFMEGRAALAWTWQDLASVARAQSKIIGRFACAIPPAGPDGETHPLKGGIVASIVSDQLGVAAGRNTEAAWRLLTYLLAPGERSVQATLNGATLQRRSVWDDPQVEEMYPSAVGDIEDVTQDLGRPVPLLKEWAAIDQIIAEQLSAAFVGQKGPKEALDQAAAAVDRLMREAGYY
jgi:multiple sugar transport system substrate-binding protein